MKSIVIKIGTQVITDDCGLLNTKILKQIISQIVSIKNRNVIVVSSGAVGAGKSILQKKISNEVSSRQVLSAIGQIKLMENFFKFFKIHGRICAQVLATKGDFRDRQHYLNIKRCLQSLLKENIIPIVNENDTVAIDELMFTDNDELSGLVTAMINADTLIILTSVSGLYDGEILIKEIDPQLSSPESFIIRNKKSIFGRGGMHTKCITAKKLSKLGISTYLANGRKEKVINLILEGKNPGTLFIPGKKLSPVKKWLGHSSGLEKGGITIDQKAVKILKENVRSLLLVGVLKIIGVFKKGDILRVQSPNGKIVGYGRANMSSEAAIKIIGKKGQRPLIHYDYLYLS